MVLLRAFDSALLGFYTLMTTILYGVEGLVDEMLHGLDSFTLMMTALYGVDGLRLMRWFVAGCLYAHDDCFVRRGRSEVEEILHCLGFYTLMMNA